MSAAPVLAQARLLWAAGAILGEGAIWDDRAQHLWWVDIRGQRLHRMDEAGAHRRSWDLPQPVGCVALTEEAGRVILGLRAGVFTFDPDSGALALLAVPEHHTAEHRLNDGKVDSAGRFWNGTLHDEERSEEGALHVVDWPRQPARIDAPYTVPNGPAFSPDGTVMYCADSPTRIIHALRPEDGMVRKRTFIRFTEEDGYPDGMTVDAEGCIWVAHWDGGCVSRFAPDGRRLGRIELPTPKVTSCAFGGADMRSLFITTAGGSGTAEEGSAGGVFLARTSVGGLPSGRMRLADGKEGQAGESRG